MFRYFLFVVLSLLFPQTAKADIRLAVLELRGTESNELLEVLVDEVRTGVLEVTKNRTIKGQPPLIMTRENTMAVLNDQGLSAEDCEGSCEVELARNIGADYVISGSLNKIGELYILSIKLHETARSNLLGSKTIQTDSQKELISEAKEVGATIALDALPLDVSGIQVSEEDWNPESNKKILLNIETSPAGATVTLDGKILCKETPCKEEIPSGKHKLHFDKKRYIVQEKILNLSKNGTIKITLEPQFGYLTIESKPQGVTLLLDNKHTIKTPVNKRKTDPGAHKIESIDPCFMPMIDKFEIKSGKAIVKNFTMKPIPSGIEVSAKDEKKKAVEAEVLVDGKILGKTPNTFKVDLCAKELELRYESRIQRKKLSLKPKHTSKFNIQFEAATFGERLANEKPSLFLAVGSIGLFAATIPLQNSFHNSKSREEAEQYLLLNRLSFLGGLTLAGGATAMWVF